MGTGDDGVLKQDFWMYTPGTDSWIQKANFPGTPRAGAVGWATFPTCFIATGEDINFEYKKDVWEYNYYANAWVQRTDFPGNGRKNAIAFVVNNVAFVGTGFSGVFEDDFYAYFGIAGINDNSLQFGSVVYPNPVKDVATILLKDVQTNDLEVKVFSYSGQDVTEDASIKKFSDKIELNMSSLTNGNYIYKLYSRENGFSSTGKIILLK
jgi:hypothetical protein